MRRVITVHGGRFDPDSVRPKIDAIVTQFDKYVGGWGVKTAKSKHAVMGPVAKILERAETGKWDAQALTGYALRVHEMNPKARGYLSPAARLALEDGTSELVALCREVPVTAVAKVVERVDYSLYYVRRKKGIEWLEKTRQMFMRFLRDRYSGDLGALTQAWGKDAKDIGAFDDVRYPSIKSDTYRRASPTRKSDTDEFWKQYADQAAEEEDENA